MLPADAARVAGALYDMGCYEVSMGDTVGVGTPSSGGTAAGLQRGNYRSGQLGRVSIHTPVAMLRPRTVWPVPVA